MTEPQQVVVRGQDGKIEIFPWAALSVDLIRATRGLDPEVTAQIIGAVAEAVFDATWPLAAEAGIRQAVQTQRAGRQAAQALWDMYGGGPAQGVVPSGGPMQRDVIRDEHGQIIRIVERPA